MRTDSIRALFLDGRRSLGLETRSKDRWNEDIGSILEEGGSTSPNSTYPHPFGPDFRGRTFPKTKHRRKTFRYRWNALEISMSSLQRFGSIRSQKPAYLGIEEPLFFFFSYPPIPPFFFSRSTEGDRGRGLVGWHAKGEREREGCVPSDHVRCIDSPFEERGKDDVHERFQPFFFFFLERAEEFSGRKRSVSKDETCRDIFRGESQTEWGFLSVCLGPGEPRERFGWIFGSTFFRPFVHKRDSMAKRSSFRCENHRSVRSCEIEEADRSS